MPFLLLEAYINADETVTIMPKYIAILLHQKLTSLGKLNIFLDKKLTTSEIQIRITAIYASKLINHLGFILFSFFLLISYKYHISFFYQTRQTNN